jgi:hypothetical protein
LSEVPIFRRSYYGLKCLISGQQIAPLGLQYDRTKMFCRSAIRPAESVNAKVTQCPLSEVRDTSPHAPSRTSESHGHWQVYDSSAAFDLTSLNPILPRVSQGLQIGGTSAVTDVN